MENQTGGLRPAGRNYSSKNDEDKKQASSQILLSFSILSLVNDNGIVCPECGTDNQKKILIKTSSQTGNQYWKCYKCSATGDAIELLTKYGNYSFQEAIKTLLGKSESKTPIKKVKVVQIQPAFIAKVDVEIYNDILSCGSIEGSIEYYGQWHIDPSSVLEAGSTTIVEIKKTHEYLLKKYGRDRLFDAGVIMLDKNGNDFFLFNNEYNVIEPHRTPSGDVVGLQFRPSFNHLQKVSAHKSWKRKWSNISDDDGSILDPSDAWERVNSVSAEASGSKVPYVAPFLSLKGATTDSLIGCGLYRVASLKTGSKVYIVEGFKDLLAARTMGIEAYAIPGTGVMPPDKVCTILSKYEVLVLLDGDKAGDKGRENLISYLTTKGVDAKLAPKLKNNYDVTDYLVSTYAQKGCKCTACASL